MKHTLWRERSDCSIEKSEEENWLTGLARTAITMWPFEKRSDPPSGIVIYTCCLLIVLVSRLRCASVREKQNTSELPYRIHVEGTRLYGPKVFFVYVSTSVKSVWRKFVNSVVALFILFTPIVFPSIVSIFLANAKWMQQILSPLFNEEFQRKNLLFLIKRS